MDGALLEREAELAALTEVLHRARHGRGGVVLVEAPPGAGKTTLLGAVRARAAAQDAVVLTGRGSELERGEPFGLARQLVGSAPGPGADRGPGTAASEAGEPARRRIEEFHAALRSRAAAAGTAVLAVDDAHWSDTPSLEFLAHVALRANDLPIALVVALRPGEVGPDDMAAIDAVRAVATRTLRPRPLSGAAVAEVVTRWLGDDVDESVSRACAHVTGGNPFYLHELLRAALDDDLPVDAARIHGLAPEGVLRAVCGRIDRLVDGAPALARAVAVLGDAAPLEQAAALAGLPVEVAEVAADALARAHILTPGEPPALTHPLIREALRVDLGAFTWRRAHRRAATLLLAEDAPPERIARHLLVAAPEGDARAAEALRAAAEAALTGGDPAGAAALLRRALDEPPDPAQRGPLLLALARAETLRGSPGAAAATEAALQQACDAVDRASMLGSLAGLAHVRGAYADAVALARRARALLPPDHPSAPALLAAELGAAALDADLQDVVESILVPLAEAATAGELPGDPVLAAPVAARVALEGPPATVRALAARAVAQDPLIDPDPQGLSVGWLGCALLWVDELETAEAWLARAVPAADARGAVLAAATARLQRAWTCLLTGRLADAVTDAGHALRAYHDGWTRSPWSAPILVCAHVAQGALDEAAEALTVGMRAGPDAPEHALLLLARCELDLARDDPASALEAARAAGRHLEGRFGVQLPRMDEWRRWAALAAHRLGDDRTARDLIGPAVARLREIGPSRQLGAALTVAGLVAADPAEALQLLDEGARTLAASPARLERARALVELGTALRRHGRPAEAKAPLLGALELAGAMGAAPLEAAARAELRGLGLRPRRTARTGAAALTGSEREVAERAALGMSTPQIARALHVTRKTVETHLGSVYRKLGVRRRTDLPGALGPGRPAQPAGLVEPGS